MRIGDRTMQRSCSRSFMIYRNFRMRRRSALVSLSCSLLFITSSRLLAAEGYFDSNGVKIRYTVQGKGEPVVLIHGFTLNPFLQWDMWGITRELLKDYQVITIDCRGHGRS